MTRLIYIIKKFTRNIWDRPFAAIGSFLSLFLLFLMFIFAWIASLSAVRYYDNKISQIEIEIFLTEDVADSTIPAVLQAIQVLDGVDTALFISRESASKTLTELMGVDLLEGLDDNPLPRSIILSFKPDYLNMENLAQLRGNLARMKGVDEIHFPSHWLEKAEHSKQMISDFLYLLGALILLAMVLNSIHSVILSARTRIEELTQLQLLGAGPVFLAVPFVLEGIFYALTASATGWLIMHYGAGNITFRDIEIVIPTPEKMTYFCLITGAVGMVSGYIGIRRSI